MYLKTQEQLVELLQKAEDGLVSLSELETEFEQLFHREPWPILDHRAKTFFAVVEEKLGWTIESPNPEDMSRGWEHYDKFREWLREALAKYLAGGEIDTD